MRLKGEEVKITQHGNTEILVRAAEAPTWTENARRVGSRNHKLVGQHDIWLFSLKQPSRPRFKSLDMY